MAFDPLHLTVKQLALSQPIDAYRFRFCHQIQVADLWCQGHLGGGSQKFPARRSTRTLDHLRKFAASSLDCHSVLLIRLLIVICIVWSQYVYSQYNYISIIYMVLICHSFLRVPVPQDSITFPIFCPTERTKGQDGYAMICITCFCEPKSTRICCSQE